MKGLGDVVSSDSLFALALEIRKGPDPVPVAGVVRDG
jgi:hypothetical protein